jgi:hypothetical protein
MLQPRTCELRSLVALRQKIALPIAFLQAKD